MTRLTFSGCSRRSGLLGTVIAAHASLLLLIGASHSITPMIPEQTLVVALLLPQPRTEPPSPAAKPQSIKAPLSKPPVATSEPRKPLPVSAPPIEASARTSLPSTTAPTATAAPVPSAGMLSTAGVNGHGEVPDAVSQARFDADYLKNPKPPYPPQARRMGEEGKVILRVQVSAEGRAESVEIKTSSGSTKLDEAAQRTVRSWRFIAAKRGETPVDSWVLVPIIFKLEH